MCRRMLEELGAGGLDCVFQLGELAAEFIRVGGVENLEGLEDVDGGLAVDSSFVTIL